MATRRKFTSDVHNGQQPLDPQNLRSLADRRQDGPAVSELTSSWPGTAEAALPSFMQVLSGALAETIAVGTRSEQDIERIVARQSLRWRLLPQLFPTAITDVTNYLESVQGQEPATEAFPRQQSPDNPLNVAYVALHNGQPHIYYDAVPTGILALRDTVLFWIDHTSGDYRSRGRPKKQLSPRSERLLAFISQDRNAGNQVTISDMYQRVCLKPPSSPDLMENSVREAVSGLNLFVRPQVLAHKTDPQAKLAPRRHVYQIRADIINECCIISLVRSTNERS
jgi:hypothetical protein